MKGERRKERGEEGLRGGWADTSGFLRAISFSPLSSPF
jgi:hypothetical protein